MMKETSSPLFIVDTPPCIHIGDTIPKTMRDTVIALVPAILLSTMAYGTASLRVMALSMATSVFTEFFCLWLADRKVRVYDGTALVAGLLFAFLLPAGAPWWIVIIGSMLTIGLGKQVFGGLGTNPLCPPLVGWACLTLSWPTYMDPSAMNLDSSYIDPLIRLKYYGVNSLPADNTLSLLMGEQLGGLGSVYILALVVGGIFLIFRRGIRWEVPVSFLLAIFITGAVYHGIDPEAYLAPSLYLLTGTTVYAAFFLATDHASTPVSSLGLIIFGVLAGAVAVLIRVYGIYLDGVPFAILLANLFTPLIDLIRPAPWGKRSGV